MSDGPTASMQAAEHDRAVAAARAHLAAKPDPARPLGPLPEGFAAGRGALHLVAEQLLKAKRELETGNEIALEFAPGGFGTPPWDRGAVSGAPGAARVEGVELVSTTGEDEERLVIADGAGGAELLGVDLDPASAGELDVDSATASALADWFAFGTVVLADLIKGHRELDPAPIRLWPEHFDVATELGSEAGGQRANYGASPGDADHPEPYLYVGPWDQSVEGDIWNASGFVGAELSHAELVDSDDQSATALEFLAARAERDR